MLFNSLLFAIFLPIVFFLYWFVWDEKMKKMLVEKNRLNPDYATCFRAFNAR